MDGWEWFQNASYGRGYFFKTEAKKIPFSNKTDKLLADNDDDDDDDADDGNTTSL